MFNNMIDGLHGLMMQIKDDLEYYLDDETFKHSYRVAERCYADLHENELFYCYVIALLHDVLETEKVTINDLKADYEERFLDCFNQNISNLIFETIEILTRKKDEKYFDYINRVKSSPTAKIVKFFDVQDNLTRCFINKKGDLTKRYLKALKILMED